MSVLVCPACRAEMRVINKHGVMVDTCTQCRGVWLDRGELERLSLLMSEPDPHGAMAAAGAGQRNAGDRDDWQRRQEPPRDGWRQRRRDDDDDDDDDRRRYGRQGKYEKSKITRLLDFFD